MNAPVAPNERRPSAPAGPQRRRARASRLVATLLGWLRFTAMALVGMLGVWLLVLLFG
jgi:hypothetical protein